MPKWNPFASTQSLMISYITVSTSPGYVNCNPLANFMSTKLTCIFTQGTTTDILEVQMGSDATSSVAAGKNVQIQILNVRTPASQTAVTNLVLQTTNSNGQLIDSSSGQTFSYASTTVAITPSSYFAVTTVDSKINTRSTIQLQIKNLNPLQAGSSLIIIIPDEFEASTLTTVTGSGGRIKINPSFSISTDKKTVTITQFNANYLEPLVNIYVNLGTLRTPITTLPSSSFTVTIIDSSSQIVETQNSGIIFTATPGTIKSVAVTPSIKYVNMKNVQYKFSFTPQDSFDTRAIIKIQFPDSISITNRENSVLTSTSSPVSSSAVLKVESNKYATITGAFTSNYDSSTSKAISFSINQITNAPTVLTTDSFIITIYYTENIDVIDKISTGITVSLSANPYLGLEVLLASYDTGYNNIMQFKANSGSYQIAKGSYLQITIPVQFEIYDYDVAESTCLKITGYTDEIQCSFTKRTRSGHILEVRNGFNSQLFSGGEFSFNISQVRNPKTTQQTDQIVFSVYDSNNNLQYTNNDQLTFTMQASAFQYASVSSQDSINGQSSLFIFTLTLSVDTYIDAKIQVTIPDDITYDTNKNLTCMGLLVLQSSFNCQNKNNKVFVMSIRTSQNNMTFIQNGTSISFALGYFFNPISLKESQSFQVETFETSDSNTNYYTVNRESKSLTIQNTQRGNITNLQMTQYGIELNSPTSILFQFTTQNNLPNGSKFVIALPLILKVNNTNQLQATVNNKTASLGFNSISNQITIYPPSDQVNKKQYIINITKGLLNPQTGPYTYDTFIIDIQTANSYSIDYITVSPTLISNQAFKTNNPSFQVVLQNCTNNCATCSQLLSKCKSCSFDSLSQKNYFLEGNQCQDSCGAGKFSDPSDFLCKSCQYPCVECSQGAQLCTKCYSNHTEPYANPQTLQCYKECPAGTFLNKGSSLCEPCVFPCYTCTERDVCLSCDRTSKQNILINYYQSKCYDVCPAGTVSTLSSSICIECTSPCKSCSNGQPDQCDSCQDGYYHLKDSLCARTCPRTYIANPDTMKCDYTGEMVFPLPFSILTVVFGFGLFIARFMKNQTRFCITLLAFTDIVLKLNWVFLLIYLYIGRYYVSASIIAYCLVANMLFNFALWRSAYYRTKLSEDKFFSKYLEKYVCTSKLLLFFSFSLSFHIFRLTYSRFLGKRQFSAQFKNFSTFVRLMISMSILTLALVCLPAVAANAYNLYYVNSSQQVFYLDLDGLILVCIECILIGFVIKQGESVAMGKEILKVLIQDSEEIKVQEDDSKKLEDAMTQLKRQSMARKYFGEDRFLNEDNSQQQSPKAVNGPNINNDLNEIAEDYSRNIFRNLFKQFQTQTSQNTVSQKYFSQSNFDFLNIEEYKKLKSSLKQLQIQLYNIRQQTETQESKKATLFTKMQVLNHENLGLLSEEERLKIELDELKSKLDIFREVTQREIEDTTNLKRDQSKHKMKISKLKQFIADTVLNKGKEILKRRSEEVQRIRQKEQEERDREIELEKERERERKIQEEEERRKQKELEALKQLRRTSYIDPTVSSLMKENSTEEEEKKNKFKREKTLSPHRARPPIHQKERAINRQKSNLGGEGEFTQRQQAVSQDRISVANNYTGFRVQSEMRAQRNITNVNSNVASNLGSPERRQFNQTQNEFYQQNTDNNLMKNRGIQGWIREQEFQEFSSNNLDKENPSIDINHDSLQ